MIAWTSHYVRGWLAKFAIYIYIYAYVECIQRSLKMNNCTALVSNGQFCSKFYRSFISHPRTLLHYPIQYPASHLSRTLFVACWVSKQISCDPDSITQSLKPKSHSSVATDPKTNPLCPSSYGNFVGKWWFSMRFFTDFGMHPNCLKLFGVEAKVVPGLLVQSLI